MKTLPRTTALAALAALALSACSTTWAEVHGPVFGVGIELSHDLHVSPILRVGYSYDHWRDAIGWGGEGALAYAPLAGRIELDAEARVFVSPLLGFHLSPAALGGVIAWSPELGWAAGPRAGLSVLSFRPPDACYPPLEGEWEGCPAGARLPDDVVYPIWLPRPGYRFTVLFPLDGGREPVMLHALGFDAVLPTWHLRDVEPP